eukprot:Gb_22441 [translate_table: standard]
MKGFLVIVLLVLHCALVHSAGQKRFIFHRITAKNELKLSGSNEPRLVSDGVHESTLTTFDGSVMDQSRTLGTELESVGSNSTESVCEQTYGVLPCTKSIIGNLFLLVVYGFFMYQSASFLSTGSEHLLTVMGPGIVGGLFLPILGALPDALLILGAFIQNKGTEYILVMAKIEPDLHHHLHWLLGSTESGVQNQSVYSRVSGALEQSDMRSWVQGVKKRVSATIMFGEASNLIQICQSMWANSIRAYQSH